LLARSLAQTLSCSLARSLGLLGLLACSLACSDPIAFARSLARTKNALRAVQQHLDAQHPDSTPSHNLRGKAFVKTWRGTVCGRGLMAGIRGRPTATTRRTQMATGVGSHKYPNHNTRTYCSLRAIPTPSSSQRQFRTCEQVRWSAQPPGAPSSPPRAAIGTGHRSAQHDPV
jgi:hypothetical protein